ncbi:pirin family protein [Hellea balneolensis]|uniref:pirin family protein n=1 Tax=Hellea balneolensis TaxID=287478 RepID=UPI000423F521|nr:pirin family protein [Hellea balneolensis]
MAQNIKYASGFRLRAAEERGLADHGWLKSAHSFSFGNYFDPEHLQFESLRVINDDRVAGGKGFPMHPHQNAEIFSYVLDGALSHKDTLGNGSTVKAGGVQYMSAGSGVRHSEYNPSETEEMAFLQIWLLPNIENEAPRYETMDIAPKDKDGKLKLFLSKDGREGSMHIRADADIYAATLDGKQSITFDMPEGNKAWVQVARGSIFVNGESLRRGDGLAVSQSGRLAFTKAIDAEFLLFDLEAAA